MRIFGVDHTEAVSADTDHESVYRVALLMYSTIRNHIVSIKIKR